VVIAVQAFSGWTDSLARLAAALIAFQNVRAFSKTGENDDLPGSQTLGRRPLDLGPRTSDLGPRTSDLGRRTSDVGPALEAIDLSFTHDGRPTRSIARASLSVEAGERVLIQGASGSGKSTLASLLAGLRAPDSGLLLLNGLDFGTVGTQSWRRRVVLVPQFGDNHIFVGTLAFNLLMGRRWPPTREDMQHAKAVCEDLGLGPLLERMPLGLHQPVGESGWQLSHGERSRVYAARALLQDPDVTILDESFAALDPGTVDQCVTAMIDRARTFVMIAHP
jgi:ATP-binding cassette subfamily B protein